MCISLYVYVARINAKVCVRKDKSEMVEERKDVLSLCVGEGWSYAKWAKPNPGWTGLKWTIEKKLGQTKWITD